jgi:hypothetical protein
MDNTQATGGRNGVEQDRTERHDTSTQGERSAASNDKLLASQHDPKANSPSCGSSRFSSLTM